MAGIRPGLAAVLPLVVDLAVAVATIALVAVGGKPARRIRSATLSAPSPELGIAPPSGGVARHRTALRPRLQEPRPRPTSTGDATSQLAAELVAAKVTRQPVETVTAILVAHGSGDPLNRIAAAVGVHHSAVRRVLDAADAHRQRHLLAAV